MNPAEAALRARKKKATEAYMTALLEVRKVNAELSSWLLRQHEAALASPKPKTPRAKKGEGTR